MTTQKTNDCQRRYRLPKSVLFAISLFCAKFVGAADADDDALSIDFAIRGMAQHGSYSNAFNDDQNEIDNRSQGATILDSGITYAPTSADLFFAQLRYANGNSLNNTGGMTLLPYGGDLEDKVTDIGGRDRDYLREAWYRRRAGFSTNKSVALTAGIVDSTNYLATNAFFGDEDSQFSHQIFSNNMTSQLPSYDLGGVLQLESDTWSLSGIYMRPKTEDGRDYNYYGAQLGLQTETYLGVGNYKLFAIYTNSRFENASGTGDDARLKGVGFTFDQQLGGILGVFVEVGVQDDEAIVSFDQVLTMGVNIRGELWKRNDDEIGIAFGRVNGVGGIAFDHVTVGEAYLRVQVSDSTDIGLNLQYSQESFGDSAADDPELAVVGLRFNTHFGL